MAIFAKIKEWWKNIWKGPDIELKHKALVLRGGVTKASVEKKEESV